MRGSGRDICEVVSGKPLQEQCGVEFTRKRADGKTQSHGRERAVP